MVSLSSHFNQDVSLYIGKNHSLNETPAFPVNVSGHLVVQRELGLTTPRNSWGHVPSLRLPHLGARKGNYFVDFFQNILQNTKFVPCKSQYKISTV